MEKKSNKKNGIGLVVALAVAIFAVVIVLTVAIVGMIKESAPAPKKDDIPLYTLSDVQNTTKEESDVNGLVSGQPEYSREASVVESQIIDNGYVSNVQVDAEEEPETELKVEAGDRVTEATTKKNNGYDPVNEYKNLSKKGDTQLSDHHNNKYIKMVSEKFNVDTERLVAIYSEPNTGSNFVLEFSGKKDKDGLIIKSPDTLEKIYHINAKGEISVATGRATGNIGVSYAEGTLCFNMIKTIVMPQYPDYFTGVEK